MATKSQASTNARLVPAATRISLTTMYSTGTSK
jgi:hypothetical protein